FLLSCRTEPRPHIGIEHQVEPEGATLFDCCTSSTATLLSPPIWLISESFTLICLRVSTHPVGHHTVFAGANVFRCRTLPVIKLLPPICVTCMKLTLFRWIMFCATKPPQAWIGIVSTVPTCWAGVNGEPGGWNRCAFADEVSAIPHTIVSASHFARVPILHAIAFIGPPYRY